MGTRLECGDLAPNFMLPNGRGEMARFYDRFAGNAMVLAFLPFPRRAETAEAVRWLAEGQAPIAAAEGRVMLVIRDGHEAIAPLSRDMGDDLDILADPAGAITEGFCGQIANQHTRVVFVIDSNQRVAAVDPDGVIGIDGILARLAELQARWEPQKGLRHAPALVLPDVVSPEVCQRLVAEWEREHFEGVITVGTGLSDDQDELVLASSVKKRRDHRLSNECNAWLSGIVGRRVVPMLQKAFQFQVGAMQHYRIAAYAAERGDFFQAHRDNDSATTEDRRFAMSLNLNDDYDGGAVRFPEFGGELHRPPMGGAVIFSCSLLHEAMPVTRGTRFVALTFFFSAREAKRQIPQQRSPKRLPGLGG